MYRIAKHLLIIITFQAGISLGALTNPLLNFDTLICVEHIPGNGQDHMVDQYMANNMNNGGGLYKVTGYRTGGTSTAKSIDILANATVTNGRLKGQKLTAGSFMSPDLSYDGKTILFAWTSGTDKCYHIFKVNSDGTNLMQLTDGTANYNQSNRAVDVSHNEFDPCWLPNGRIVFISERRGGYGRCHTWEKPTFTLYSMKDDGTDIYPISYHETNEWHPSVDEDGMIVYTRWDYVDRDDCIAHHLWTCFPDGRDPRAPHANYPLPTTTMEGSNWPDGRNYRPNGEWNIRSIPGTQKYVATAGGHHAKSFGQLIIIEPSILDDNKMSQIKGITSNRTTWSDEGGPYGTAWPLSEQLFLCNKDNTIIIRDISGTEDVLYTAKIGRPLDPIPLRARKKPPVLPMQTWQGERASLADHKRATILINNVTYGDMPLPLGTKVTALRIIQVIPKATPLIEDPRIGYPAEALARLSLGTVPVESDGSVYCEAPVGKEIYFQLLNDKGMAVHSMRSGTYVHAGEQMTCAGCHEDKWKATPLSTGLLATRRPPSKLTPEPGAEAGGVTPINYSRLVKPVFDAKCVVCHKQQGKGPADMSYGALKNATFWFCGEGNPWLNGDITTAVRGGSRSIPGKVGAAYSTMGKALLNATHQAANITPDEFRRVTLWLDGNSNRYSAYTNTAGQDQGSLVWPEIDFDASNPTGVESGFPLNQTSVPDRQAVSHHQTASAILLMHGRNLIFKNPGAGNINIRIVDAAGRTIAKRISSEDVITIHADIPRGCYVVKVSGGDGGKIRMMRLIVS